MSARVVLRKRLKFDDPIRNEDGSLGPDLVRDVVLRRNRIFDAGKTPGDIINDPNSIAIRRSSNLAPHLLPNERGQNPDTPKDPPFLQEAPPPTDNGTGSEMAGTSGQTPQFLTTWGLALRQNPREAGRRNDNTGLIEHQWRPGRSPSELRKLLLEPVDVLTEIAEDNGLGDLPTQVMFSDQERRSVAVDTSLEPVEYAQSAQHWGTRKWGAPSYGTARQAMRRVEADWTPTGFSAPECRDGENINVVIVDTGLNEDYLRSLVPDLAFGGGFVDRVTKRPDPGAFQSPIKAMHSGHGNMIARNILRVAPKTRIFDAPVLPPRVTDVAFFTHTIELLYEAIWEHRALSPYADQPWVIVNAWAIADNIQERGLGPLNMLFSTGQFHNTNTLIELMSEEFAIIFAAGNNGLFEPARFAGLHNRGPHRAGGVPPIEGGRPFGSIAGANALPGVLTTGASTVHGKWIGASAQGDGPETLRTIGGAEPGLKPDLVAPSWFYENNDRHQTNTGTSAACGVAAGLVASAWSGQPETTPQDLLEAFRNAAQDIPSDASPGYRARYGHGVARYPF